MKSASVLPTTPAPVVPMPSVAPPAVTVRDLSPAMKAKVRAALDAHFDDARGCYIDGYSDQRIGQELDIPWACVTQMREAAYGPILIDPEVEALREEHAKVMAKIEKANEQMLQAMETIDALSTIRKLAA